MAALLFVQLPLALVSLFGIRLLVLYQVGCRSVLPAFWLDSQHNFGDLLRGRINEFHPDQSLAPPLSWAPHVAS